MNYEKAMSVITSLLQPGEAVIYAEKAGLNNPQTNNGQFGAIAVTGMRLLFAGSLSIFNPVRVTIPLWTISSVNQHLQVIVKVTRITAGGRSYDFVKISNALLEHLEAARASAGPPASSQFASTPTAPPDGAAPPASIGDEIAKIASLRASGVITEAEFEQAKARILGR